MTGYRVPAGTGQAELTEKRSRFIGHVWRVTSEEEARRKVSEVKSAHHDARHNCWCYLIGDSILRYADDGEPQGTAGLPMLEVFRREEITDVCCVVTRYFGGILLGTGGLARAYAAAARLALEDAGTAVMQHWKSFKIRCPYALFERVKSEIQLSGGAVGHVDYGADVTVRALVLGKDAEEFSVRLSDLSSGAVTAEEAGEEYLAVKNT